MLKKHCYMCSFGEVLWDIFPTGKLPGGAPMNFAIGLNHLGVPAVMLSRVGGDALGTDLENFLKSKGCTTRHIQVDRKHDTGTVLVHATSSGENRYEIVENVAWDFIEAGFDTRQVVKNAYGIAYGSLSCRSEVSKKSLLSLLQQARLKVFDVNFRAPYYHPLLVEALMQPADMVKMNEEELNIISSWYNIAELTPLEQMNFLKKEFNLKQIVVTRGANGAFLLDDMGFWQSHGFKVKVEDTVGSGDAFLAGFVKKYFFEKAKPDVALKYACALGAYVATQKGANPLIKSAEVERILEP